MRTAHFVLLIFGAVSAVAASQQHHDIIRKSVTMTYTHHQHGHKSHNAIHRPCLRVPMTPSERGATTLSQADAIAKTQAELLSRCDCGNLHGCHCGDDIWDTFQSHDTPQEDGMDDQGYRQLGY